MWNFSFIITNPNLYLYEHISIYYYYSNNIRIFIQSLFVFEKVSERIEIHFYP